MSLPPKVCPECREEYLHSASQCVHCEVDLVLLEELRVQATDALPPTEGLHCLRTAAGSWAVGLSEQLRVAGIAHRIDAIAGNEGTSAFGIWVRPIDVEAAKEIDLRHARGQMPDLPEDFDADFREAEAHTEGDDACPACGEPIASDASECGSCGLFLGELE